MFGEGGDDSTLDLAANEFISRISLQVEDYIDNKNELRRIFQGVVYEKCMNIGCYDAGFARYIFVEEHCGGDREEAELIGIKLDV